MAITDVDTVSWDLETLQTLMASILHKYVTGRLVERPRRPQPAADYALRESGEPYDE